mgnify:CR=1 FL=1
MWKRRKPLSDTQLQKIVAQINLEKSSSSDYDSDDSVRDPEWIPETPPALVAQELSDNMKVQNSFESSEEEDENHEYIETILHELTVAEIENGKH